MAKYCSDCGTKLDSDEKYCSKCGAKINSKENNTNGKIASVNNIKNNKKSITIGLIIIIIAIMAVVTYSMIINYQMALTGEAKGLDGKTETEVIASEPMSVESQIETMKNGYDMGYNNETISWLEGLNNCVYVYSDSALIIMNRSEANKLPIMRPDYGDSYKNTTYYYNKIKFNVLETHSMGSGLKDCILVDQVEVIGNTSKTL